MGANVDAVQKQSEELLQLEDTLLEAIRPGLAVATAILPPIEACGRSLKIFSDTVRVAVRDFLLQIKGWGVRDLVFASHIEQLAPGLQQHPLWATYSEKVLDAALKV